MINCVQQTFLARLFLKSAHLQKLNESNCILTLKKGSDLFVKID